MTNACNSFPCLNGGVCYQNSNNSYACACLSQFTGRNCEISKF